MLCMVWWYCTTVDSWFTIFSRMISDISDFAPSPLPLRRIGTNEMEWLTWTHSLNALNSVSHIPFWTSWYDFPIHCPYASDYPLAHLAHIHLVHATHLISSLDGLHPSPITLASPNSIEKEDSPAQHMISKLSQMSWVVLDPWMLSLLTSCWVMYVDYLNPSTDWHRCIESRWCGDDVG